MAPDGHGGPGDLLPWRSGEPIRTEYYGYEVVTVPPPSNGGDWLLEMLNIMEEKDISQS